MRSVGIKVLKNKLSEYVRLYHGPAYLPFLRLVTNSRVFEHPESTIDAYVPTERGAGLLSEIRKSTRSAWP
jgi:hypothetical protein